MSLDRVLCLGCSPSWLWIWVQTAWDAQIPQVSGTRLTCWRLSHLSPSPAWCWWKTIDIMCSRLDSTLVSPHYTDKRQYLKETQGIKNELKVLSSPPTSFEISIELHPKRWGAALLLFVPSFCVPGLCFCQSWNILPQQAQLWLHQLLASAQALYKHINASAGIKGAVGTCLGAKKDGRDCSTSHLVQLKPPQNHTLPVPPRLVEITETAEMLKKS